jgi:rhodanese-related sulfurtransferase
LHYQQNYKEGIYIYLNIIKWTKNMIILHIFCIASMMMLLFGSSLFGGSSVSGYETLNVAAASDLIETSGKYLQILDVRTPEEFQSGHIRSAVNINVRDPDFAEQISTLKKAMPILTYCRSGIRSESAASTLVSKGFKQIYNMQGGVDAWVKAGYPVE